MIPMEWLLQTFGIKANALVRLPEQKRCILWLQKSTGRKKKGVVIQKEHWNVMKIMRCHTIGIKKGKIEITFQWTSMLHVWKKVDYNLPITNWKWWFEQQKWGNQQSNISSLRLISALKSQKPSVKGPEFRVTQVVAWRYARLPFRGLIFCLDKASIWSKLGNQNWDNYG